MKQCKSVRAHSLRFLKKRVISLGQNSDGDKITSWETLRMSISKFTSQMRRKRLEFLATVLTWA